ncbi:MAG: dimethylsulfonioproprionate lyase family protein [Burkholderiaceae bacterium]
MTVSRSVAPRSARAARSHAGVAGGDHDALRLALRLALIAALRHALHHPHAAARTMARQGLRLLAGDPGGRPRRAYLRPKCNRRVRSVGGRLAAHLPTPGTGPAWREALGEARHGVPAIAHLAAVLRAGAAGLAWTRRPGSGGDAFGNGHANAWLIGAPGCGGIAVGLSLMAPGLCYPEHAHPPRELYFVLLGGRWWRSDERWFERRAGQWVHNPPAIRHAMRSDARPLLAIWYLRMDGR